MKRVIQLFVALVMTVLLGNASASDETKPDGKVYRDSRNGYFAYVPLPGWKSEEYSDPRTKVSFSHPNAAGVFVRFIVREAPDETFEAMLKDDKDTAGQMQARGISCTVKEVDFHGLECSEIAAQFPNDSGTTLLRKFIVNGLHFNIQYSAPGKALFEKHRDDVLKSMDSIAVLKESKADPAKSREQMIAGRIRLATLTAQWVSVKEAQQILRDAQKEFPDSKAIQEALIAAVPASSTSASPPSTMPASQPARPPATTSQTGTQATTQAISDAETAERDLVARITRAGGKGFYAIADIRPMGTSKTVGVICIAGRGSLPLVKDSRQRLGDGVVLEWIHPVERGAEINAQKGKAGLLLKNGKVDYSPTYEVGAIWQKVPSLIVDGKFDLLSGVAFVPGVRLGALYPRDGNLVFDYVKAGDQIVHFPGGTAGSVHRLVGEIAIGGWTFVGEEDVLNPLTFLLTNEGYVYVRGKGTITLPSGDKVRMPQVERPTATNRASSERSVASALNPTKFDKSMTAIAKSKGKTMTWEGVVKEKSVLVLSEGNWEFYVTPRGEFSLPKDGTRVIVSGVVGDAFHERIFVGTREQNVVAVQMSECRIQNAEDGTK